MEEVGEGEQEVEKSEGAKLTPYLQVKKGFRLDPFVLKRTKKLQRKSFLTIIPPSSPTATAPARKTKKIDLHLNFQKPNILRKKKAVTQHPPPPLLPPLPPIPPSEQPPSSGVKSRPPSISSPAALVSPPTPPLAPRGQKRTEVDHSSPIAPPHTSPSPSPTNSPPCSPTSSPPYSPPSSSSPLFKPLPDLPLSTSQKTIISVQRQTPLNPDTDQPKPIPPSPSHAPSTVSTPFEQRQPQQRIKQLQQRFLHPNSSSSNEQIPPEKVKHGGTTSFLRRMSLSKSRYLLYPSFFFFCA
jgi:hypothetical protein